MSTRVEDEKLNLSKGILEVLAILTAVVVFSILLCLAAFGYFGPEVQDFMQEWAYNIWRFRFL